MHTYVNSQRCEKLDIIAVSQKKISKEDLPTLRRVHAIITKRLLSFFLCLCVCVGVLVFFFYIKHHFDVLSCVTYYISYTVKVCNYFSFHIRVNKCQWRWAAIGWLYHQTQWSTECCYKCHSFPTNQSNSQLPIWHSHDYWIKWGHGVDSESPAVSKQSLKQKQKNCNEHTELTVACRSRSYRFL